MKNTKNNSAIYFSRRGLINFYKQHRRKRKHHREFVSYSKLRGQIKDEILSKGIKASDFRSYQKRLRSKFKRPMYSETVRFLHTTSDAFCSKTKSKKDNGYFEIPPVFSLTENYSTSFSFLKRLFNVLYYQSANEVIIDYKNCTKIDLDASVCMDIILAEFIKYFYRCRKTGYEVNIEQILPINFGSPHVSKILFSIGAFSNLKKVKIEFKDIITYPLSIGKIRSTRSSKVREIHITELVAYVIKSMQKMNRVLTPEAEDNLFKVIGEVLINAEEHSTLEKRYSIGYFQDSHDDNGHIGIFNLVILNFGTTIYEKFKDPECPNQKVVEEMKALSEKYTKGGFFSKAEFDEQALWTLYALQEEVTSKADWKRGNGSIRFIESFFNLKGEPQMDNFSYLSIVSGNARITFDGTYNLVSRIKGRESRNYKMMTFNESGMIENQPDKRFVTFAENYFPGTMISAKICIKEDDTESFSNE
jgi:hypothetical protein